MADIRSDWTIYQKLQYVRNQIAKMSITKSGFNAHLNYAYFELGDFEAQATELFNEAGLCPLYSIKMVDGVETAIIMLTDGVTNVPFSIPTAEVPNMKGIFELGAKDTYCLRYLLARHVLMLPDNDVAEVTNEDSGRNAEEKKATEKQIELIRNLYDAENIVKMLEYYNIDKLSDLSLKQASEVIARKKNDRT